MREMTDAAIVDRHTRTVEAIGESVLSANMRERQREALAGKPQYFRGALIKSKR